MKSLTLHPTSPLLASLTWRAISINDLSILVELAEECFLADGGLGFMNLPRILAERYFRDAPGVTIGGFAPGGKLVACTTIHLSRESDTERAIIVGQVHPKLRNQGIGSYLMRWSEAQAQALLATVTADVRRLQIATESLTEEARHLYHSFGFEAVHESLVMGRDLRLPLPVRPLAPGITIAAWQPELADQFFRAYEAAFRDRPGFPGFSAEEWISDRLDDEDARPEWSLLARSQGEPLGFLTASRYGNGFVVQVGVVPDQRRQGLGSALMVESMRRMQEAGESTVQLTVHVNNPGAYQAYVRLGFTIVGRRARFERIDSGD